MSRKLKKVLIAVLAAAGLGIVGVAGIYFGLIATVNHTQSAYEQIAPLNLADMPDGVYNGKAGEFICSVDLDVTVKDHRITDIAVNRQISGGSYQARGILPRIVGAQSADVDAVTGATLSSQTIMTAVYDSLK
jgi:uncharacterized protein with FMN-binding domain